MPINAGSTPEDATKKIARFKAALAAFLERLDDDASILAVVQLGAFSESTIWHWDSLRLWIIEIDGVTRRLRADGEAEDIERHFVEHGIPIHAQLIPRARFKQMVDGSSRTAFSCNFFEWRTLVHCKDSSIQKWFDDANSIATKDQDKERLMATTWLIHSLRYCRRHLELRKDLPLAQQSAMWVAHSLAALTIIDSGKVTEEIAIYEAKKLDPGLFEKVYDNLIAHPGQKRALNAAVERAQQYLDDNWQGNLKPLLHFLKKQKRVVPLSEISDHFFATPLYPWYLESACEWLEEQGHLEKVSSPFKITKRSRIAVEEPAYFWGE